jgi:glycosyltransferase involved in cell wall biosynthesis
MSAAKRRGCIVVHGTLAMDPRVQREAAALLEDGWALDIICLRDRESAPIAALAGAHVRGLPVRRHRGSGMVVYLTEYALFVLLSLLLLSWLGLWRRYRLVQAHNVPDCLVFSALVPRLFGARVVLDIRDPLPDLYASKYGGSQRHPLVRAARWVEKVSVAYADHVLTPGEPSRQRLIGRGADPAKVTNILNSADPRLFPHRAARAVTRAPGEGFTVVYHGGLFKRYGLDLALRAVARLRDDIPDLELRVAGYGEEAEPLRQLAAELGIADRVQFAGWIAPHEIAAFTDGADLGIAPYRQDTFTDLIYPTKAFEYMALGIPVIMSALAGMVELFPGVPDLFFRPDDVDDLARLLLALYGDPARGARLNDAAQRLYAPLSWASQQQRYVALIDDLVRDTRRGALVGTGLPPAS